MNRPPTLAADLLQDKPHSAPLNNFPAATSERIVLSLNSSSLWLITFFCLGNKHWSFPASTLSLGILSHVLAYLIIKLDLENNRVCQDIPTPEAHHRKDGKRSARKRGAGAARRRDAAAADTAGGGRGGGSDCAVGAKGDDAKGHFAEGVPEQDGRLRTHCMFYTERITSSTLLDLQLTEPSRFPTQ